MTPATLNLEIVKGLTFDAITIVCKDETDTIVNITGWKAFAGAKLGTEYIPFVMKVSNGTLGEITLEEIPWRSTSTLKEGVYAWDLALEDTNGRRSGPYLAGSLTVSTIDINFPNA